MTPDIHSLFSPSDSGTGELFFPLLAGRSFRLESINSFASATKPGVWYDQDDSEWVLLVRGSARLEFLNDAVDLVAGDYLLIPPHLKHRVASTSEDAVWLAIHHH